MLVWSVGRVGRGDEGGSEKSGSRPTLRMYDKEKRKDEGQGKRGSRRGRQSVEEWHSGLDLREGRGGDEQVMLSPLGPREMVDGLMSRGI